MSGSANNAAAASTSTGRGDGASEATETAGPAPPPSSAASGATDSGVGGGGTLTPIQTLTPDDDGDGGRPPPSSAVPSPASVAWHCEFSRSGSLLAACYGAPDCSVRIWARRRRERRTARPPAPMPLARSTIPEGDELHAGDDGDAAATNAKEEEDDDEFCWYPACTLSGVHERTVRSLSFAPGDRVLATAGFDGTVCIWERMDDLDDSSSMNWECTAQLEGHESEVKDVAWNDTGTLLATCGRDKSVWVWECVLPGSIGGAGPGSTGEGEYDCVAVLNGHEGDVKCITFARSNDRFGDGEDVVVSGSYDDTVRVWAEDDAGDWYCASTLELGREGGTVWSVAASRGGERLVTGHDDGSLGVWKCYAAQGGGDGTWKCVGVLPEAHGRTAYGVHCAPERSGNGGRIASCGGDDAILVYREEESSSGGDDDAPKFSVEASVLSAHQGDVNCVRWHPRDGTLLASAGDDGAVKLWRYNQGTIDR